MKQAHLFRQVLAISSASGLLLAIVAGCGTNLDQVLEQLASAAGRTYLDLALTEVANNVVASLEPSEDSTATNSNDGQSQNGNESGNGGQNDQMDGGGGADGAALFAADCASCHGADGASGFAPVITGFTADELATGLAMSVHSSIELTDDDVAAIAAFLAGAESGTAEGDVEAGAALFASSNCSACHCADASGGCAANAPALGGTSVAELDAKLRGSESHVGGKYDLSDQDLRDVQAFLAGV